MIACLEKSLKQPKKESEVIVESLKDTDDFPPRVFPGLLYGALAWGFIIGTMLWVSGIWQTIGVTIFSLCFITTAIMLLISLLKKGKERTERYLNTYDNEKGKNEHNGCR